MVLWTIKIATAGGVVFVALLFVIRMMASVVARSRGSLGIDASRPMWFCLYLLLWALSFAIAYCIFPRFGRM
jgi:hypothetical protein